MFTVILRTIFSADTVRFEPGLWVLVSVVLKGERIEGSSTGVGLRFDFLPLLIGRPIKRGKKSKRSPTPVDDPSMRSPLRTTDTSTQSPGSKRTVSAEKMVRRMTVNMADTVSRMTSLKHSHEKQRVEIAALKAVATETLLEITDYSSSSAGNAEREQQRSTRSRGAAPSYKSNHATRQPLPLAVAFCRACRWESRIMTYVKLRAPQATRHPVPTHNAPSTRKKQEARSKKKQEARRRRQQAAQADAASKKGTLANDRWSTLFILDVIERRKLLCICVNAASL